MTSTSVDLLEELRAALDGIEPLIAGRIVDIELARLRVLADPVLFRREFASLIESAVADVEPTDAIVVRVTRTGSRPASTSPVNALDDRLHDVVGSMTVRLAPGVEAADA